MSGALKGSILITPGQHLVGWHNWVVSLPGAMEVVRGCSRAEVVSSESRLRFLPPLGCGRIGGTSSGRFCFFRIAATRFGVVEHRRTEEVSYADGSNAAAVAFRANKIVAADVLPV